MEEIRSRFDVESFVVALLLLGIGNITFYGIDMQMSVLTGGEVSSPIVDCLVTVSWAVLMGCSKRNHFKLRLLPKKLLVAIVGVMLIVYARWGKCLLLADFQLSYMMSLVLMVALIVQALALLGCMVLAEKETREAIFKLMTERVQTKSQTMTTDASAKEPESPLIGQANKSADQEVIETEIGKTELTVKANGNNDD